MVKDERSELFTNTFVPDMSKICDFLQNKTSEGLGLTRMKSLVFPVTSNLDLDFDTKLNFAVIRASKIEEMQNKSSIGMNMNVFDHKNIYYDTKISHSTCTTLEEGEFTKIKFEYDVPCLLNDFIKYITGNLVDLHEIYGKQVQKNKYMDRIASMSPNSKHAPSNFMVNYTQEDYNSLKFWGLVDPSDKREDPANVAQHEQQQKEKKNKKANILPIGHQLLSLKEFIQYFKKNHVRYLEKNFVLLAKKDVTETEKDIYITLESLEQNFDKVFGYKNPSLAKRLYLFLAKHKTKARISFEAYMRRFFKMLYGSVMEKNKISFSFYDYDNDGCINSLDIYDLYRHYEKGSKMHQEATLLVDDLTQKFTHTKKPDNYFNYTYFSYIVKSSYITKEIGKIYF